MHVSVSWSGRGFVATSRELREPVIALSRSGLRRRIEDLMVPDQVEVRMHLDRKATQERDRRKWSARAGTGHR